MFAVPQNRWQAFAIHLLLSLLVFIVLASIIYFFWYPGFLFRHDGGLEGMGLIAGVDFLIGPFLTVCVYKLGKRGLALDLFIIAVLQAGCLSYGMWTIWQTRPVAVVYVMGTFRTISYQVFVDYDVRPEQVPLLDQRWPVWVAVDLKPEDIPSFQSYKEKFLFQNSQTFNVDRYVPFRSYWAKVSTEAMTYDQVVTVNSDVKERFAAVDQADLFFPLGANGGSGYLVMDKEGEVQDAIITLTRKTAYEYFLEKAKALLVNLRHT